ncbi:serine hydrolase [Lewinella sp. W8]|uniref:serine hydrolase n=1 Tax=Lewinella sp. W8 TaxID=2528208 RepID=UPI001068A9CA|nr:serine hydrolase [Lewinella sp. W8]MTB51327.1 serine hydrolase [Lewinella sp. W8]
MFPLRTTTFLLLPLLFTLLPGTCVRAQNGGPSPSVDRLIHAASIPGFQGVYFEDGEIVTSLTRGITDADTRRSVTPNTVFSAASLSKPLLAYLTLQLVDAGQMDLDVPLVQYFNYPDVAKDDRHREVTARMVLSHTTGLPNWRDDDLQFRRAPGKKFGYSGEGFVWLQRVVEHLSGKDLQTLAQEKIFTPFGMEHSSFVWKEAFEQDFARPHKVGEPLTVNHKPEYANAAHSLKTTAEDYARFLMALAEGKGLSATSLTNLLTIQSTPKGSEFVHWGLGVGLQESDGGTQFWHWGDNYAFKAYFTVDAEAKRGLVYFANDYNGLSITPDVTDLAQMGSQLGWEWADYKYYKDLPRPKTAINATLPFRCVPCNQSCDTLTYREGGYCYHCGMELIQYEGEPKQYTIAFYLQNGVEVLDFAGPMEVFAYAGFEVFTVSKTRAPIQSQGILTIVPDHDLESAPEADILAFFGGNSGVAADDPDVINWVKARDEADYYFSVCTGAFVLGEAGMLEGQTATTFHRALDRLEERFPNTTVLRDARFVDNGRVITTAGISAGIDGALHLVAKLRGEEAAKRVARYMEYDKWTPGEGVILKEN